MGNDTTTVSHVSEETFESYCALRSEAADRMGVSELRNDEFLDILLRVYSFHLDGDRNE